MKSQLCWNIIRHFTCKNSLGFGLEDVNGVFPGMKKDYLGRILTTMVEKGMLFKIDRDIYYIPPLNGNSKSYKPDGHQVAKYLMLNRRYYIGYNSALKIHGLSSRSESCVQVVTGIQRKPALRKHEGIIYQFIHHASSRFFGYESMWINHYEKAMVSDLEKTIVDIAVKPHLSGGILEVGTALFQAKDRSDPARLCYYLVRNINRSARKRILFLTDILGLEWTEEHDRLMTELGSGISLLDPTKANKGKTLSKYGLKINVDPDHLKNKILQLNSANL